MEQGLSSDTHSDIALKRLSTVVEQEQVSKKTRFER
jgi:hypothetical protein